MLDWMQVIDAMGVVARTFIAPILAYAAYVLRDIRTELRTLNGRMTRVEAWKEAHDDLDERLHLEYDRRLHVLERMR